MRQNGHEVEHSNDFSKFSTLNNMFEEAIWKSDVPVARELLLSLVEFKEAEARMARREIALLLARVPVYRFRFVRLPPSKPTRAGVCAHRRQAC
jgi:hypothetical protein